MALWNLVASTMSSRRPPVRAFAEDLFRFATGVAVSGVDEGDAGVEGLMDHLDVGVVVGIAPGAEHDGAQAQSADGDTGVAQDLVLHGSLLCVVWTC